MIKFVSLLFTVVFSLIVSCTAHSNPTDHNNTLLIIGDSLSAGYKMPVEKSWPILLPPLLAPNITVINASISGDTTGNGLARLPALLTQHQPDYVLIELGANDGLRGFSPTIINNNLIAMIDSVKANNAQPLLMQIQVPTNYGKRYGQAFYQIYPTLSRQKNIELVPFFLEHVITKPEWMMDDGLHPNELAQPWIAGFMATELSKRVK